MKTITALESDKLLTEFTNIKNLDVNIISKKSKALIEAWNKIMLFKKYNDIESVKSYYNVCLLLIKKIAKYQIKKDMERN